jgi:uncharacterized membrane protein YeiH
VSRDILLNKIPGALTNPWYLILCIIAGLIGMALAFDRGQKFREAPFQFMTSFSLPWYAIIGVQAGLNAQVPAIGCVLLGIVGPTAGRYLIDITAGKAAKQFIRGEWFVGTAVLTSVVYILLVQVIGLTIWPATLLTVVVGFAFRVAAQWFPWEEPLPRTPAHLLAGLPPRESLRDKMQPGWEPKWSISPLVVGSCSLRESSS